MNATLRFGALSAGALAAIVFGSVAALRGQGEIARRFVFTEKAGFIIGQRATISAADSKIIPDPLGRYALIQQQDPPSGQPELLAGAAVGPPSSSLLLYDARTGRTKIVWRSDLLNHRDSISEVTWLNGADAALVVTGERGDPATRLMPDGRKPESTLLLIRPTSTAALVRTVLQHEGDFAIDASPTAPMAILVSTYQAAEPSGALSLTNDCMTVSERGELGPRFPLAPHTYGPFRWSDDGKTAYFVESIPANIGLGGAPPTKARRQYYSFNCTEQTVVPIEKLPAIVRPVNVPDKNPLRLVSGAFTAPPPGAGPQQPTAKPAQFAPLWVVRADGKHEGQLPTAAVLAPDAEDSVLLADDSAALYIADHAVYAVTLSHQRRPDFDAVYREMLKNQTMKNAKQLGLAMVMYTQDYDEKLPLSADVSSSIGPYLKSASTLNNPETDTPGFTYIMNGQQGAVVGSSSTTVLGYLAGPGGRAVVYADGHVTWEEAN